MATKFSIFCDEQQTRTAGKQNLDPVTPVRPGKILEEELNRKELKPLGLRQTPGPAKHAISSTQETTKKVSAPSGSLAVRVNNPTNLNITSFSTKTTKTELSNDDSDEGDDEEDENNLSMASLGSDYVPSISGDNNYDDDDNCDLDLSFDINQKSPINDEVKLFLFNPKRRPTPNSHEFQDLEINHPFDEELYHKVLGLELADDGLPKFESDEPFDF